MSATNGLASRSRLIVCSLAVVFALSALFASTAGAHGAPIKETYLSLGDSLAFGYSKQLANENEKAGEPPSAFTNGYTDAYFKHLKPLVNGVQLVNNGCPGETSGGLIGTGPLGVELAKAAGAEPEASCEYHNVSGLPLHHEYGTGKSQLENALAVIGENFAKGTPVTTISFEIGANDELHAVKKCEEEAKPAEEKAFVEALISGDTEAEAKEDAEKAGKESVENCLKEKAKSLFEHILKNVGAAMFTLREGGKFGSVNYAGKIIIQGGYDPYGNVFGTGELLPGSTSLAALLNSLQEKEIAPKFAACFANPFSRFNPQNKKEPERLQSLTNMANFTEFEGKKNGPDIHPTPAGYKALSSIMQKDCG